MYKITTRVSDVETGAEYSKVCISDHFPTVPEQRALEKKVTEWYKKYHGVAKKCTPRYQVSTGFSQIDTLDDILREW